MTCLSLPAYVLRLALCNHITWPNLYLRYENGALREEGNCCSFTRSVPLFESSHKKYVALFQRSLFSKTSCFVNTVFKGLEFFFLCVWLNPPLACVLCCVSFAELLPFVSDESLWSSSPLYSLFHSIGEKHFFSRHLLLLNIKIKVK